MLQRLGPTLVVLGAGFVALTVFLAGLEVVFLDEDERVGRQEAAHRHALESYASTALARLLRDELDDAATKVERVQANPLVDAKGLVFIEHGVQVLPRVSGALERNLKALTESLLATPATATTTDDDDPWAERVAGLAQLNHALTLHDDRAVERLVRSLLAHRSRWVLSADRELAFSLALTRQLMTKTTPSSVLLERLLLTGFGGPGAPEGLEAATLRAWPTLGADDVAYLCDEVRRLADDAHVDAQAFASACSQRQQQLAPITLPPGPWLMLEDDGAMVLAVTPERIYGQRTSLIAHLERVTAEMQLGGLLSDVDSLTLDTTRPLRLSKLHVEAQAPRFVVEAEARHSALRLKTGLVVTAFLLGLGIVVTAIVAQQRKHRFVELKSDFVATVSHELRTPLASVRLLAETLERRLTDVAAAKDYPSRIVAEVDGLALLVENVLSYNRIDKGRLVPRLDEFRLSELWPALEGEAQRYREAKVELEFTGDLGCTADRTLLTLLFQNLLRNACRYNARDPVRFAVSACGAEVTITDNGVGIPTEAWQSVFEPFRRLEGQQGRGGHGSGLGLPLCRLIARLHHGDFVIARSSAEGTTFVLTLPTTQRRGPVERS